MQNNNGSRVIPTTVFLLYRKLLVSYKVKNAPRGCASRGEEVSCKQHRFERERVASDSLFDKCCYGITVYRRENHLQY